LKFALGQLEIKRKRRTEGNAPKRTAVFCRVREVRRGRGCVKSVCSKGGAARMPDKRKANVLTLGSQEERRLASGVGLPRAGREQYGERLANRETTSTPTRNVHITSRNLRDKEKQHKKTDNI